MQSTLTAIVTWLSITSGLPAIYDHPRVEFAAPEAMHAIRYQGRAPGQPTGAPAVVDPGAPSDRMPEVGALYDDTTRTLYLPSGWAGETYSEISVLVHEMVHHLQNVGGLSYECPQAREKPAYAAQDRWLALFGRSLETEFGLDPLTVLVRTRCMH